MDKKYTPDEINSICLITIYNSFYVNDVVINYIKDFGREFKKSDQYIKYAKKTWNNIEKSISIYETKVKMSFSGDTSFLADANDEFYDIVKNDIMKMEYSSKMLLDKNKIENSKFISDMATMQTLLEISIKIVEADSDRLKEFERQDWYTLRLMRLSGVSKAINQFIRLFYKDEDIPDLNDENCNLSSKIIIKKMANFGNTITATKVSEQINNIN